MTKQLHKPLESRTPFTPTTKKKEKKRSTLLFFVQNREANKEPFVDLKKIEGKLAKPSNSPKISHRQN